MKAIINLVVATLCAVSSFTFAQNVPLPTLTVPNHLNIGKMAIAEALAKAVKIEVVVTAPSVQQEFRTTIMLSGVVKSPQDIVDKLDDLPADAIINDPKDIITTTAVIYGLDEKKLFLSQNSFRMEKVGYDSHGKAVYQTPESAKYLFFELLAEPILFPGANEAWAVTYRGESFQLQCYDGKVVVPGWMSLSNISEVVINGTWRYDMNTGLLLTSQDAKTKFGYVYFDGLQQAFADPRGVVTVYTQPRYGYVPLIEFKNESGRFYLNFSNGEQYDYTKPVVVRIATLDDINSGRGWTIYDFPQGGLDLNLPAGTTYFIYPEYDAKDLEWFSPTSATPAG